MRATYSPEDNKLRLYSEERLDAETYSRVRAAGFIWAGAQKLFVAPQWTPGREDFLIELCGEIEDEDKTLQERAEQRAERFDGYSANRLNDATRARDAVAAIADGIPLGQPILVGHHSERHARRDQARIQSGMKKAVDNWKTAKYWEYRAEGAKANAAYKALPAVRLRRIKGLEAEARGYSRTISKCQTWAEFCARPDISHEQMWNFLNVAGLPNLKIRGVEHQLWYSFDSGKITIQDVVEHLAPYAARSIAYAQRWLDHLNNRIAYERAMLGDYEAPKKEKRKLAPAVNFDCKGAIHLTAEQWAKLPRDYSGYRPVKATAEFGAYRQPVALGTMIRHKLGVTLPESVTYASTYLPVFVIDKPVKNPPPPESQEHLQAIADAKLAQAVAEASARAERMQARAIEDAKAETIDAPFRAMQDTLKSGGVQIVTANQLFPTPKEIARRMVDRLGAAWLIGRRVLEPSAGTGELIRAIWDNATGVDCTRVVAVEINPKLVDGLRALRQKFLHANSENFDIREGDFLQCNGDLGTFDAVVMNPPFENGSDIKHILHARKFLKPGGKIAAICADGPRQQRELQSIADSWEELPAGTFAGTNVRTALLTITV